MEGTAAMAIPATTTEPRLRHEEKHQVNLREALVLSRRLEKLFPHDPHAGPEGSYQVVSLYYDDPYDTALRQKLGTAAQHIKSVYGAGYRLGGTEGRR